MRKALFLTFFALTAPVALAQDPVKVDAKHYSVLLENDQVRVLKIHYNPKEKSVMHEHPAGVAVYLTANRARFNFPDGTSRIDAGKAGSIRFTEAGKHLPQNIGTAPMDVVLVELKGKAGSAPVALDPVKVDPVHHKVEVDNDQVRVLRINFKAHDKTKVHEHPNGVAIYLTDMSARFMLGDGKTREGGGKRGEAVWAVGEKHSVNNLGARPTQIILVELK